MKESENGKREANEKKVGIAKRQRPPQDQERQQRSQVDLSQIRSSSSSYSVDGDLGSDLNQVSHAASSNPSISSNQQRLDSAATSVARDAVAKGAAIAIVENASKEAAADDDDENHSRASGREANEKEKRKDNNSNEDVDNSKDDGWRKVETKFADEERISSLTLESVFGQTEKPKRGDEYDAQVTFVSGNAARILYQAQDCSLMRSSMFIYHELDICVTTDKFLFLYMYLLRPVSPFYTYK